MARFDVYRVRQAEQDQLVVDVQSDFVSAIGTRVVVPLVPTPWFTPPVRVLNPFVEISGQRLMVLTQELVSVPARVLRNPLASLANCHDDIRRALDILLTGY